MKKFARVISADSHVMEPPDLWEKALGDRYADYTPRRIDEHLGKKGSFFFTGHQVLKYGRSDYEAQKIGFQEAGWKPEVRVRFQKEAGVDAELMNATYMLLIMQGRQRVMCPDPWSATERAREKILLIDSRQDVGYAALEDAIADARHPERAQLALARLRDVGPSHRRWPVPLGVQRTQRCFTPGYELLLEVVHSLAITPRCRMRRYVTEVLPQPCSIDMMRQTGKTELGFLPSFRCYPFESR